MSERKPDEVRAYEKEMEEMGKLDVITVPITASSKFFGGRELRLIKFEIDFVNCEDGTVNIRFTSICGNCGGTWREVGPNYRCLCGEKVSRGAMIIAKEETQVFPQLILS